jgi:hypothetical protein
MATPYVLPDVYSHGYVFGDAGEIGEEGGVAVLTLASPGQPRGATNFGDPDALQLIHHTNPGPYSDELVAALATPAGVYLFGFRHPSSAIDADELERFGTLKSIGDVSISSVPLGNDLIGSIGASESPTMTLVFSNDDGFWSLLVVTEPLLGMPLAIWDYYSGAEAHKLFEGQITRVLIRRRTCELTVGEP